MKNETNRHEKFSKQIGAKEKRMLDAQSNPSSSIWLGLGVMGLVGWSVSLPTLIGTGIGIWLDQLLKDSESWTLILLVVGLLTGCLNAWRWLRKEENKINRREGRNK